jgi:hypothetical protein
MKLQEKYLEIVRAYIAPYTKDKNVVGITLNGGVSRGTGDIYSEIDIYFFVIDKSRTNFPPKIKEIGNDIAINGVWFEVKVFEIAEEKKREWGMVDRWDAVNGKLLYDTDGKVRKLLREKTVFRKGERKKLLSEYGFLANWCIQLAEVFDHRGDLRQAHLLVNESLDAVINNYFVLAKEFIPYFKWKIYYFQKLKKPSKEIKELIFDLYRIKDYSRKELYRRMNLVRDKILLGDLKQTPDWPYKQKLDKIDSFVDSLKEEIRYSNPFGEGHALVPKRKK